jgi:hypothetical protein
MEYLYTTQKVVKLTNNIIKAVEQIVELDDAHYEDAHVGIDMEDYSAKYIDGDDILFDDLKGGIEYCDLDLYHPYSMDWIRYNSKKINTISCAKISTSSPMNITKKNSPFYEILNAT